MKLGEVRVLALFQLKRKYLGWLFYLPFVSLMLISVLITTISFDNVNVLFILVQLFFVPLASLWTIYLFYDLFTEENIQFFWAFYKSNLLKILGMFFLVFVIPLILIVTAIEIKYANEFLALATLLLLISQVFIVSIVNLIIFGITKDVSTTLSAFFLYISADLATFGESRFLYHFFLLNLNEIIKYTDILNLTLLNLLFGFLAYKIFRVLITE